MRSDRQAGKAAGRCPPGLDLVDLVRRIAAHTWEFRDRNDFDDAVQEGCVAALRAIPRFDKRFGVKLETYLAPRIRGAIKDHIEQITCKRRHHAHVVNSKHPRQRPLMMSEAAVDFSGNRVYNGLSGREMALGFDVIDTHGTLDAGDYMDAMRDILTQIAADRSVTVRTKKRNRKVLIDYYIRGRPAHEVGRRLGITEGRVCQILKQIRIDWRAVVESALDPLRTVRDRTQMFPVVLAVPPPPAIPPVPAIDMTGVRPYADQERAIFVDAFTVAKGDAVLVTRALKMAKATLYRKIRKHGIEHLWQKRRSAKVRRRAAPSRPRTSEAGVGQTPAPLPQSNGAAGS